MKSWKEVKVGDYIYYYDHCKYHKQLVHDIKEETKTESFTDWFGKKYERTYTRFIIRAGRSYFIVSDYYKDNDCCYANSMKRFTCEEAYQNHEDQIVNRLKRRYKRLKTKYDRCLHNLKNHGVELSNI